jgi:hypothetical protein
MLCQCIGLSVFVFLFSSSVFAASAGEYTFTDPQGRTLVAKIISVAQPDVYLQSGNGQPFPVKIGAFIAKDQAYIQQWVLDNQKAVQPFNIFALKNAVADTSGELPQQGFKVTLKNLSGKDAANLRIDYVVLRQPNAAAIAPLPRITGTANIGAIAKNGEASIDTDSITTRGSHLAVWVRVYNSAGTLLQEWSSAPKLTDAEDWDSTDNTSGKHGNARGRNDTVEAVDANAGVGHGTS